MKTVKMICALIAAVLLCGCQTLPGNSPGVSSDVTGGTVTGGGVPDAELTAKDYSSLVGVDALGRVFNAAGGERDGKYVGCFYWLWQGQHQVSDIYDISKLLKEAPDDLWNTNGTEKSPLYAFHWWGEPLYGYYSATDEWVLRRHLELLTYAGVDFIAVDLSNGTVYPKPIKLIMKLIEEYRSEGFDCPQITFFTHVDSKGVVEQLYSEIYKKNWCPQSWWTPYSDGKPYMIAYPDPDTEGAVTGSGVKRGAYSKEIAEFFHFRAPQWPDEEFVPEAFPWIDWGRYEQKDHKGVISVSPASGWGAPMSHALSWAGIFRTKIRGRGWNGRTNDKSGVAQGLFYASQWDYAVENDPEIVFIDGFNEWIAQKLVMNPDTSPEVFFADAVNEEFSRDIEPMKGGSGDNYLLQTVQNVRRFKSTGEAKVYPAASGADWSRAKSYYDFGSDNSARKSRAAWGGKTYRQEAGRVNVQKIELVHDEKNLYFRITAQQDIGDRTGTEWMNLFIGTGEPALKGWEGYEYVLNRASEGGVSRLSSDFSLTDAGKAEVSVQGKEMYITLSRELLGLAGEFSLYFKLADSVEKPEDITDYYVSGQSLPMGRFSFSYRGK